MSTENPIPAVEPPAPAAPTPAATATAAAPATPAPAATRACQNCGEPLLGDHCYACGQPTKGLVRHFSSIIGDFLDSVFELDSRILRTLGPLLFKPGYLSTEYFAGRRVRYVSPVRLFVFLAIVAFFAARLSFDISPDNAPDVMTGEPDARPAATAPARPGADADADADADASADADATPDPDAIGDRVEAGIEDTNERAEESRLSLRRATTVAEVEKIRDEALAAIATAREESKDVLGVSIALDVAEEGVRNEAERRIEVIREAEASGEPVPIEVDNEGTISFNGTPWDPVTNRLEFAWLPDAGNRGLNDAIGRAKHNMTSVKDDPNRLKDAILSTVPTTLFLLLPLFALFLKVAYLFKRRLYMEHLIVALHSHSFLCLGLFLALVLDALKGWTAGSAWMSTPLGWMEFALLVWMPVYLLLMQKRVYGQGWIMTVLKFSVLGMIYVVLISLGFVPLLMFSLVTM